MGCCFSKELNPNPVSERTSLLQTAVTESFSVQDVKQYGQMNRAVDVRSDAASINLSASLSSIDKRNSSVQEGTVVWDECKEGSCNKPLGKISKDLDSHSQRETAVLHSVKQRIAENAVKRAVWFCEVDSSQHRESTRFKPRGENVSDTLVAHGHHVRATCTTDNISSGLPTTRTQEHGQTIGSINRITDPTTNQFTTRYLYDDDLDSDEKKYFLTSESSMKRRTQSFYSICSIDTDDLGGEHEPAAMTHPATFNHTDLITNTEKKVFISTSLSHAALETSNGTSERQEVGEKVSEDLPAETLLLTKAHVLPDVIGVFCDVGSNEDAASDKSVSVSPEDRMMENSENYKDQSHITGLDRTVDEAIPDLLERSDRLGESMVDRKNMDCLCQTRVNTDLQFVNVAEMDCEVQCLETLEQEPERVSSESRNLDNNKDHLSSYVHCREPKQIEPSADVSSLEGDQKSQGFSTESSSQDTGTINLDSKSFVYPVEDSMSALGESLCSYADSENAATEPEPRSRFNSLQNLNFFTSDISGENDDALQPKTFQTGFVDYPGFNACPLLTHYDAEKREINLGMEDVTCHISSTELSGVALEFEIAVEHVEMSKNSVRINSTADYDNSLEASQSLVKDFCENLISLTQTEQECSPSPVVASFDADYSVHTNLLEHALENLENLKISDHLFPATAHEGLNMKEEDGCSLKEIETLLEAECFNEQTLQGQNQILLRIGHVKSPKMELHYSKLTDLDLTLRRNNDEQVIHSFLEGSSENTGLSIHLSPHAEPPDTSESTTLSKNSTRCESAHIPPHTLLEKTHLQSSSDLSNQELELTHGDVQDVHMISTAEQQVEMDYNVPRTIKPMSEIGKPSLALEGPDSCDKGMGCFVTSRFQGYQIDGLRVSGTSCGLGTAETCPIPNFSADDKAIPLPVEPDQVDLYASMPSYEIHFLGPDAVTVPVQSLTSTNGSERERGALNMVSDLLGKSEVNKDCIEIGDCSQFLSVWAGEPELESAWQYRLSEEDLMRRGRQEEGEADLSLDSERVQAFTSAYPFSLLVSDEACVWDWQNAYGHLESNKVSDLNPNAKAWASYIPNQNACGAAYTHQLQSWVNSSDSGNTGSGGTPSQSPQSSH